MINELYKVKKDKKEKEKQLCLLDKVDEWEEHWKDMPEYINKDISPYCQITINFYSKEDIYELSKLLNIRLTEKTRSFWFPDQPLLRSSHLVYISDES